MSDVKPTRVVEARDIYELAATWEQTRAKHDTLTEEDILQIEGQELRDFVYMAHQTNIPGLLRSILGSHAQALASEYEMLAKVCEATAQSEARSSLKAESVDKVHISKGRMEALLEIEKHCKKKAEQFKSQLTAQRFTG